MPTTKTLADIWTGEFSDEVRRRGYEEFQNGYVEILSADETTVRARIDDDREIENVVFSISNVELGTFLVNCECDRFSGGRFCKHLWAVILTIDEAVAGNWGLSDLPEEGWLDDRDDDRDFTDNVRELLRNSAQNGTKTEKRKGTRKPAATWRQQLQSDVKQYAAPAKRAITASLTDYFSREAWFVLDVGASVAANQAVFVLFQRERKKNGDFGKIKRLSLNDNSLRQFPDKRDVELLHLIRASEDPDSQHAKQRLYRYYSYGKPSLEEVSLVPSSYATLFPAMCATGRLVWQLSASQDVGDAGKPVAWDDATWRFRIVVSEDETAQQYVVKGAFLHPESGATLPLTTPVLIERYGLFLTPDRLARHNASQYSNWLIPLQKHGEIRVPYSDRREFVEHLWMSAAVPEVDLPESLRIPQPEVEPKPILRVRPAEQNGYHLANPNTNKLVADVLFDYGDRQVPAADSVSGYVTDDSEGHPQLLVRRHESEQEWLKNLLELNVAPSGAPHYRVSPGDVEFTRSQFPKIIEQLVRNGWTVEADGKTIRQATSWSFNVTSGVDWFELDGRFEFGDASVQLPDLLKAIRSGENYITLDDGSQGLLPQEWLEKYASIADLAKLDGENVRFRRSQALMLDALLAAQETDQVQVDQRFAEYREKLSAFSGVAPKKPPKRFQGTLRDYQRDGLGWLNFLQEFGFGGCLADDMGLGKTVQVLALLESRRKRRTPKGEKRKPSLAVVPKSLIFNWIEEAANFTPELRILNYTGTERAGRLEELGDYDLLLTTYGTLRRDIVKLKDIPFDYAILDESQAIKNAESQNSKSCRLIDANHRLAMTGTPIENHLGELWSLFEFLNPGMLGRSKAFNALSRRADEEPEALKILSRAISPYMLRRTKQEVLTELPEKTEQTLYCDLVGKQRKEYDELRDYYRKALTSRIEEEGMANSKMHVLEALMRLRQAACHPGLIDKKRVGQSSAKLDTLLEQMSEVIAEGHKVLVFSQFTSMLAIVEKKLKTKKITYEYLDGKTTKRQDKVERFQNDPDCPVFLISMKAGGYGLNLTAADYVFILDPWWNPAVESQAIDRTHRIGQERPVFAYRLIARDTVEEKILELQKQKRDLADAIISANNSVIRNLTSQDLELLLS